MKPDLIIFRYEDDNPGDEPFFGECRLSDGQLVVDSIRGFTVELGDSYRDLRTDQIVFAKADGDGSKFITSFSIKHDLGPQVICRMDPSDINAMLPTLLEQCSQSQ